MAREEEKRLAWEADAPARELRLKIEAERLIEEDRQREQRLAKVDANIARHEEKQKVVKEQQHEQLLSAQARMAKILERIQK